MLEPRDPSRKLRRRPSPEGEQRLKEQRLREQQAKDAAESQKLARRSPTPSSRSGSFDLKNLLSGNSNRSSTPKPQVRRASRREGSPQLPTSGLRPIPNAKRGIQQQNPQNYPQNSSARMIRSTARFNSSQPVIPLDTQRSRGGRSPQNRGMASTATLSGSQSGSHRLSAATAPQRSRQSKAENRPVPPILHALRLLILGLGVGAIAGTLMAVITPTTRQFDGVQAASVNSVSDSEIRVTRGESDLVASNLIPLPVASKLGQELTSLKTKIQTLAAQYAPDLTPGVFLVDLDTGGYVDLNGTTVFPAASTIKVPILVALLQDIDAGKVRWDENLVMLEADLAEGSGDMEEMPPGTKFSVLETATNMITISDNTATNMIIRKMGGADTLNQRFQSWGMTHTIIRNPLADLTGTNTVSPKELTNLLVWVSRGNMVSLRSRDRFLEIMRGTISDTLIPSGVADERAVIGHKTGTLDHVLGDTAIIDMPSGKRFALTVLVKRPTDADSARELIVQITREVYSYLSEPPSASATSPSLTEAAGTPTDGETSEAADPSEITP
jgi:beta-lactamase class A